nr:major head protein [Microvirus sp.]
MNRNVESHFAKLPRANIQRSVLDLSCSHKTSFNAGDIIPFYCNEVLPGDTFDVTSSKVVRSQTLLTPIMDNMYLDTYWFFIPNRLVWSHWEEFCGDNKSGPWTQQVEYSVPCISSPVDSNGTPIPFESGTLADYMGYPLCAWKNTDKLAPSALPFRAYALVCNHFFRDENFANPLLVPLDDANQTGSNASPVGKSQDLSACANGGRPYKANKFHDYFTSALPSAQRGNPVQVPVDLKGGLSGIVPAQTYDEIILPHSVNSNGSYTFPAGNQPLVFGSVPNPTSWPNVNKDRVIWPSNKAPSVPSNQFMALHQTTGNDGTGSQNLGATFAAQTPGVPVDPVDFAGAGGKNGVFPLNLGVDLSAGQAQLDGFGFTINQFRIAYTYQCYLEAIARSGSRYGEMINQIFGVTNPDSRLQHPEYLGGNRVPIQVNEITNTTQADKDFLGDVGAKSATSDVNHDFVKSFTEYGILLGVCVVRYDHSYSQGLPRWLTRKKFTDFYNPMFANLGEMPIYKAEIYAGSSTYDENAPINKEDSTFGYQEAWADYRYTPNRVSSEMRPGVANSLSYWHLGDFYAQEPTISEEWLFEDEANVNRVLAVTSAVSNQFWADIFCSIRATRCMPMYSVPGLEPKF